MFFFLSLSLSLFFFAGTSDRVNSSGIIPGYTPNPWTDKLADLREIMDHQHEDSDDATAMEEGEEEEEDTYV